MTVEQQKRRPVKSAILIDYNQFSYLIIRYLLSYANNSNQLQEWLKTHFIQLDAYNAAIHNNFEDFVEARGKQILERINMLCKVKSDTLPTIDEYEESDTSNDVENDFIQA